MAKRRPSSKRWMREHLEDPYVKAAKEQGYRSRAVFKLLQILEKHPVLAPGMAVVDLGAAPGGWTQAAVKAVGRTGTVVALDILPMEPMSGAEVIQGDFLEDAVLEELLAALPDGRAGAILSDMAPNMMGVKSADRARGEVLAETAFQMAEEVLEPGGGMIVKVFQGAGFHDLVREARKRFKRVKVVKPPASRSRSAETYLVGEGFDPDPG